VLPYFRYIFVVQLGFVVRGIRLFFLSRFGVKGVRTISGTRNFNMALEGNQGMEGALARQILDNLPQEWRGTTFRNSNLLGRGVFSKNLNALLDARCDGVSITTSDLEDLGNAQDYLRVASNLSTTLEALVARRLGCAAEQVLSFSSVVMPLVAVVLTTTGRTVHVYTENAEQERVLSGALGDILGLLTSEGGGSLSETKLEFHVGEAPSDDTKQGVVIKVQNELLPAGTPPTAVSANYHAVVTPEIIHILDTTTVQPAELEVKEDQGLRLPCTRTLHCRACVSNTLFSLFSIL